MPYGLSKDLDTPENNAFMEKCVKRVMQQNSSYDKGRAIAICKNSLRKGRGSLALAEKLIGKELERAE